MTGGRVLTGDEHWLGGEAIELEWTVSASGNVKGWAATVLDRARPRRPDPRALDGHHDRASVPGRGAPEDRAVPADHRAPDPVRSAGARPAGPPQAAPSRCLARPVATSKHRRWRSRSTGSLTPQGWSGSPGGTSVSARPWPVAGSHCGWTATSRTSSTRASWSGPCPHRCPRTCVTACTVYASPARKGQFHHLTSTDTTERTLHASRPAPPHRSRRGRQLTRTGSGRRGFGQDLQHRSRHSPQIQAPGGHPRRAGSA
jgi:hypothetical protein